MLKKIVKFAKYNSLVVVVIAIAFIAVASAMADEDTRDKIIGEEIVEKSGVDNTLLLAADLENFDMEMKITNAMEDPPEVEDPEPSPAVSSGASPEPSPAVSSGASPEPLVSGNFYIDYQYKTLAIKDNVWQEVLIAKQMTVSKRSLEGRDLGLYVMEELGEIIDYQLAYLKEVQENEADKGVTVVLETTEYTGLIGLVLDTKTKELPGYEPVVQPEVAEVVDSELDSELSSGYPELSSDESPVELDCNPAPQPYGTMEPTASLPEDNNYPDDAAYWEQVKNNCLAGGGFWYGDTCNVEEEEEAPAEEPPAEEEPIEEEPAPADEPPDEDKSAEEEEPIDEEPVVADEEPVEEAGGE